MNLFENILYNLYCFIFNNNFYVNNFKSSNDIKYQSFLFAKKFTFILFYRKIRWTLTIKNFLKKESYIKKSDFA